MMLKRTWIALAVHAALFVLVVLGIVPRAVVPFWTAALIAGALLTSLEQGILFFVAAIPLFIAIPLTASYDNLNMWRPLSLVLFGRFLLEPTTRHGLLASWRSFRSNAGAWLRQHAVARRLTLLLVLAALSLIAAPYKLTGAIRIIYFINLSMVPTIIYWLLRQGRMSFAQLVRAMAIPVMIVIVVGFLQLASTYLMDVYQFMRIWGEEIQFRQFGAAWSHIAVWIGNTWLAYYGEQLSLRMFSLFPDSHSFPTFLLLGMPALLALALGKVASREGSLWQLMRTRARWSIIWVPLAMFAALLSGTRGIWAGAVGVALLVPLWFLLMRSQRINADRKRIFGYVALTLVMFFMLFAVAWPVFVSPQFLLGKGDWGLLGNRVRSIIDFGETSNSQRLAIWRASLRSIADRPILGVGIGNFPVVVAEDIRRADAGSTAHNLYLHIAAEMGIFAALEAIVLLGSTIVAAWRWFVRAAGEQRVFAGALLLYLPWVYAYVLTDPILFDERIFLFFSAVIALAWAHEKPIHE